MSAPAMGKSKSRFDLNRNLTTPGIWSGKDFIRTVTICDLIRLKEIRDLIQTEKIQVSNCISEIMPLMVQHYDNN